MKSTINVAKKSSSLDLNLRPVFAANRDIVSRQKIYAKEWFFHTANNKLLIKYASQSMNSKTKQD